VSYTIDEIVIQRPRTTFPSRRMHDLNRGVLRSGLSVQGRLHDSGPMLFRTRLMSGGKFLSGRALHRKHLTTQSCQRSPDRRAISTAATVMHVDCGGCVRLSMSDADVDVGTGSRMQSE
jgi:hypothetical protein